MALVAYGSTDESEGEQEEDTSTAINYKSFHNRSVDLGLGLDLQANGDTMGSSLAVGLGITTDICSEKNEKSLIRPKPLNLSTRCSSEPKYSKSANIDEIEQESDFVLEPNIFAFLPEPCTSIKTLTVKKKNDRKVSQPVKITLPSLSEFNDEEEDEPTKKKLKPSIKGSGLFAILPAPKNIKQREAQRPFVPHVLTKKVSAAPLIQKPSTPMKESKSMTTHILSGYDSEGDEDQDFFSLNYTEPNNPINALNSSHMSGISDDCKTIGPSMNPSSQKPLDFDSGFHPSPWVSGSSKMGPHNEVNWQGSREGSEGPSSSQATGDQISASQEDVQLDAEAMQRLCGRRSKNQQPVEFIEVNGREIMPDPNDWLVKQLSEEQPKMRSHSHKRNDGPTTQQRRKHQITYLAFQAKENELELKNQWSQNRMSRKQTQSKYGF